MPDPLSTYHVVLRAGTDDSYTPDLPENSVLVVVRTDGARGEDRLRLDQAVWESLADAGLSPTQTATDFYRLATAAYCSDLLVPHETAFDRWSRDIVLYVPVSDKEAYVSASASLKALLDYLTGDYWTLVFREKVVPPPPIDRNSKRHVVPITATKVCLLSGGLDSAIGGSDLIAAGETVAFVSHNAKSGGATFSSPAQRSVTKILKHSSSTGQVNHLRFRVNPPPPKTGETVSVTTTRSRSIMFVALGLLVASALDGNSAQAVPLVIPENGLISLNVPLTKARLGSWSTRTTHPHTLAMLRQALRILGLRTPLIAPYATFTKGEMLAACVARDQAEAVALTLASVSCAHPNQSRFLPPNRRQPHCGTCVPCIIRRASTQHAGIDVGGYSFDLPSELDLLKKDRAADALAFQYALQVRRRPSRPLDIHVSGPLHVSSEGELRALNRVYDAGMDEVAHFLGVPVQ